MLTVGNEILLYIMTPELGPELENLVAKGPASPHVQDSSGALRPLSKLLLPDGVQSSTCLFAALP